MHGINTMALTSEDIWQKFDLTSNNSTANSQAVNSNHCHSFESILKPAAMLSAVNSTAAAASTNSSSRTATSISKIMDTDSLVVPDIGDILSDTNLDLDINLDGGIDMDFDYLLDDFLSTKEPLRYDCMWSGERDPMLMNLNNGASNMKASCPGNGTVASEETVIPCTNLDITAGVQSMSCFDTPLSSETSDLDETSSDLEGDVYIQRTSCADRLLPCSPDSAASDMSSTNSSTSSSPVHFFSDHSYVATTRYNFRETSSPTCVTASNHDRMETHDNEIQSSSSSVKSKSLSTRTSSIESTPGQQNAFRIPAYPTSKTLYKSSTTTGSAAGSNNSLIKLPAAAKKNSQAKFKFQVKFKSKGVAKSPLMLAGAAASSSSRSLLRSTHVRSSATRNLTAKQLLAMTSNKSLQVSKVGTRMNSDNRRLVDMINSPRLNGASPSAAGAARSGSNANMTAASAGSFVTAAAKDAGSTVDSYKKRSSVRDMHNILERQRRIDLRNAFDTLKGHLPDLQKTDKASKIMILTRAAEYCSELTRTEGDLRGDIRQEKLQQQYLVKKLNQLKKK